MKDRNVNEITKYITDDGKLIFQDEFNMKNGKVKNTIEITIKDDKGNIVKQEKYTNTDTLIARCMVWENPQDYLTMYIGFEDPKNVLNLPDNNEVYKYMKTNYNTLLLFSDYMTNSFTKVDDYTISSMWTWTNNTLYIRKIYFIASYYDNRKIMFTYYLLDAPLEILPNYNITIKYFIHIDKYVNYSGDFITTDRQSKNNVNDILEYHPEIDVYSRVYKYTRVFTKTKPYLGIDTSDYSATISFPSVNVESLHPEKKSNILTRYNQYDEYHTYELYLRFLEDGDVGNTNAMLFMCNWFYNKWYKSEYYIEKLYLYSSNSLFYNDKFKNKEQMCYDPLITDYTNAYIVYSDGSYKRVKTGHYKPNNGEFIETNEDILLKPLKRSIIDFPLVDGVNTLKEFFKLCLVNVNHNYATYIGWGSLRNFGHLSLINTWLTTFYSNIDKQLKYYLHWGSTETDPYFYIVTNKEISQIDFNGTVVDNTAITPFYHETIDLSEPYPRYYSSDWKERTQMDFYIYKIHLSDYIDVSSNNPCKVIVSFTSQPQIVFCYKSNCYVYAIDCDEKLVNTNDVDGEDAIICRSVYKCYDFSDTYHKVKQFPESEANNYVAKITSNSLLHQYPNNAYILETPQLCFGSIIFNNTKFVANKLVTLKDSSDIDKFQVYFPIGNIIKDLDNDIVYVFGHTYWQFHSEYLSRITDLWGNWFTNIFENISNMLISFENNNFVNIILPLLQSSYIFNWATFYTHGTYPNMYKDRLKNFDVSSCRSEIETQTIDLFGKQFKMCIPIENEVYIGQLKITFQNSSQPPTFVEGEFLGIPCCNKWLITDSLEKWRIFAIDTKSPENEKSLYNYLEDFISVYSNLGIKVFEDDNYRTNMDSNMYFRYWNDHNFMPLYEIEIPDEQYKTWNTLYFNSDIVKYRGIYFVEDTCKFDNYEDNSINDIPSLILFYPKFILTPEGAKEIEPCLVLLNNTYELEFINEHGIDSSNYDHLSNIGYIKPLFSHSKVFDDVYWLQKNNFLIYVYFKEKGTSNEFIRNFKLPIGYYRRWIKALFTLRNSGFKFGMNIALQRNVSYSNISYDEIISYPFIFESKTDITNLNERNNVVRCRTIQYPAFRNNLDIVNVVNFGNDEKTVYEWLNVDPNNGTNKIIPKTFYLDVEDFGITDLKIITNGKDTKDELIVYFGWAYPPENRPGNDISEFYPILNATYIRNYIGDNFKVYDLINGNEIQYWFVNGEEYYTDTHTASLTPTNYILLNSYNTSPRDNGSEYTDNTETDTINNIGFRFSFRWDNKHSWNHVAREGEWGNDNVLQPTWNGGGLARYSVPSNFSIGDNTFHPRSDYLDIFWNVNPKTFLNNWVNSVSPSYYVGNPHPIPGFMPSYWLDFIIKHNKPNIRLWAIKVVKDTNQNNQTTNASINGKIVDSQIEIPLQDTTSRVKVIHQQNRKLIKQDIKYIYSVGVHEFNMYYAQGLYDLDGNWLGHANRFIVPDKHMVRYIVKVENNDGSVVKYFHYDKVHNKWVDITGKITSEEDLINYGFDKYDLEIYGHKLNNLIDEYMSDTDKLSFVIAMKNESNDEYGYVEIYGISIEAEFNDDNLYRELTWTWIDTTTQQLIDDITGKSASEVTIGIKGAPTHWVKFEISTTGTSQSSEFKWSDRFVQLPVTVYLTHSSYNSMKRYPNYQYIEWYVQNYHGGMYKSIRWLRKTCQPIDDN